MTRVLVVGSTRLGLEGLASILERSQDLRVMGAGTSLEEASVRGGADVLVVDAAGMTAAAINEVLAQARRRHPGVRSLVLVENADDPAFFAGIDGGAAGCLCKDTDGAGLCCAVENVSRDAFSLSPDLTRKLLARVRGGESEATRSNLTPRELEVLKEIGTGATNMQVSRALGISESTVKNHLYSIYRKLGTSSRSQALSEAFRRGIVTP